MTAPLPAGESHADRDTLAIRVARAYYLHDQTMDAIARDLFTSRSTVSRLLSFARSSGLVDIRIRSIPDSRTHLGTELAARFGLRVRVVAAGDVGDEREQLDSVVSQSAMILARLAQGCESLGIEEGDLASSLARHLPSERISVGSIVGLPARTSVNPRRPSADPIRRIAAAWGAATPETASTAGAAGATYDLASRRRARDEQRLQMAIFRLDRVPISAAIRRVPRRIAVAAGAENARSVQSAIIRGAATDLVIDAPLARKLLDSELDRGRIPV